MSSGFFKTSLQKYLDIDAVNFGLLSLFKRSPAACKEAIDGKEKEATKQMEIGTAVHMALLEQELFAETYIPLIHDGRTREGKDERSRVLEAGRIGLKCDDYNAIVEMSSSLATHPRIRALLDSATSREETAVWHGGTALCKSRRDVVGDGWIMDVKTTASIDRFSPFQVTDLGYYRQAAWYKWGDESLGRPEVRHFFFAVVANSSPYESALFRVTEDALKAGQAENEELLQKFAACCKSGIWSRHVTQTLDAEITSYKLNEIEGGR